MNEKWFAVVDRVTGEAVSFGTVLADPLPSHLEAIEVAQQPDGSVMWDARTRALVARPPRKTASERLKEDPQVAAIYDKLTPLEQQVLSDKIDARGNPPR